MGEYKKSVAVDLDGVLAKYTGWKGERIIEEPMSGAREFLENVSKKYHVIIHTTRKREIVWEWLKHYGLDSSVTDVNYCLVNQREGKPVAVAYVDDRAVRFTGDFEETLRQVEELAGPAYKKDNNTK